MGNTHVQSGHIYTSQEHAWIKLDKHYYDPTLNPDERFKALSYSPYIELTLEEMKLIIYSKISISQQELMQKGLLMHPILTLTDVVSYNKKF